MAYTTVNKSTAHFNTVTYTGNGGTNAITGVGFQPDWVWLKRRDGSGNHNLYDAVRGTTKYLESSSTAPEQTKAYGLTAFGTDGFTLGSDSGQNGNSQSFISWNWKAGNSSGSANNDGNTASTVSVNTTSGFSIVKWTGTGSATTIGHGLGAVPAMYIVKNLSTNSLNWRVYHQKNDPSIPQNKHLALESTQVVGDAQTVFNDTAPTNQVFSVGTDDGANKSGDNMIAYVFAEKTGFSKFNSYTGNGNTNGTFVYTGFKPAFLIIKNTAVAEHWVMHDNKRPGYNGNGYYLYPNLSNAEVTNNSSHTVDFLSNGFKIRSDNDQWNDIETMIYMCFGQSLVGSNNVPNTAV